MTLSKVTPSITITNVTLSSNYSKHYSNQDMLCITIMLSGFMLSVVMLGNMFIIIMLSGFMLSVVMLANMFSIIMLSGFMLCIMCSIIMLSFLMRSIVMLSVIMLSVVAPINTNYRKIKQIYKLLKNSNVYDTSINLSSMGQSYKTFILVTYKRAQ
jgi:hypothetical protein